MRAALRIVRRRPRSSPATLRIRGTYCAEMGEGWRRRISSVNGARVALGLTLAVALSGVMQTAAPRATHAVTAGAEVLMIGDSVLDGLAQGYSTASRQALAARHSLILDAAGCRRLITTSCRIPPAPAPTNALTCFGHGWSVRPCSGRCRGVQRRAHGTCRNRRWSRRDHRRSPPSGDRSRRLAHLP